MLLQKLIVSVVLAQMIQPAREGPALESYLGLFYQYRQGETEEAKRELSSWPESRVTQIIEQIERIKLDPIHPDLPFHVRARTTDPYIQAAVLLHTDLALGRSKGRLDDSREYHLGVAKRLSELIEDPSHRQSFGRDWLLAVGYHFQSMLASRRALEYFGEALELAPEDGEILLAAGTAQEDLGWNLQRLAPPRSASSHEVINYKRGMEKSLKKTRSTFERALKADPDLLEARLRLGRTQQLLGNIQESLRDYRACADTAREPALRLLSNLFLGQVLEKQGRLEESVRAYRIAFEIDPGSQVVATALSHALHSEGRRAEARELLAGVLVGRSTRNDSDPWWRYPFGRSESFKPLLGRMRQEILF